MRAFGLETISQELASGGYFVQCIVNPSAAVFFPGTVQHRDVKTAGVSYEDDYRGNAMAATITPGRIDVRFHQNFADEVVKLIFNDLLNEPPMTWATTFAVRYQDRLLRA